MPPGEEDLVQHSSSQRRQLSQSADLLSVRALRLKWRTIWWSGSGCFSITSSSSSSSTLGDFYTDQEISFRPAFSRRHTIACKQRRQQSARHLGHSTKRNDYILFFFFRTDAPQDCGAQIGTHFPANPRNIPILNEDKRKETDQQENSHANSGHPRPGRNPDFTA